MERVWHVATGGVLLAWVGHGGLLREGVLVLQRCASPVLRLVQ